MSHFREKTINLPTDLMTGSFIGPFLSEGGGSRQSRLVHWKLCDRYDF